MENRVGVPLSEQDQKAERIREAKEMLERVLRDDRNTSMFGYGELADLGRAAVYSNVDQANYFAFVINALERGLEPDEYYAVGSAHPDHIPTMFGSHDADITLSSYHKTFEGIKLSDDSEPSYSRSVELWRLRGIGDYVISPISKAK